MIRNDSTTPILKLTLEILNFDKLNVFPIMLLDASKADSNTNTLLALTFSSVYLVEFKGAISSLEGTVTECFVLMMENVPTFENRHDILVKTARKKLIVVIGMHYLNTVGDSSNVPIVHIDKFGYAQIYCPTFDFKFWKGQLTHVNQFKVDLLLTNVCPVQLYIRY